MFLDQQNSLIFLFIYLNPRIEMKLKKIMEKNYLYQNQNPKNLENGG